MHTCNKNVCHSFSFSFALSLSFSLPFSFSFEASHSNCATHCFWIFKKRRRKKISIFQLNEKKGTRTYTTHTTHKPQTAYNCDSLMMICIQNVIYINCGHWFIPTIYKSIASLLGCFGANKPEQPNKRSQIASSFAFDSLINNNIYVEI